jgi:hypothetical protein
MAITPLPPAPSKSDPTTFNARAEALVAALNNLVTEINAQANTNTFNLGFATAAQGAKADAAAPLMSPSFTGTPTAPTATASTNTTQLATTAFAMGAGLGSNQTWQNVTASRVINTTYTNSTPRPIFIAATIASSNTAGYSYGFNINGVLATRSFETASYDQEFNIIVPAGATYSFISPDGSVGFWAELR